MNKTKRSALIHLIQSEIGQLKRDEDTEHNKLQRFEEISRYHLQEQIKGKLTATEEEQETLRQSIRDSKLKLRKISNKMKELFDEEQTIRNEIDQEYHQEIPEQPRIIVNDQPSFTVHERLYPSPVQLLSPARLNIVPPRRESPAPMQIEVVPSSAVHERIYPSPFQLSSSPEANMTSTPQESPTMHIDPHMGAPFKVHERLYPSPMQSLLSSPELDIRPHPRASLSPIPPFLVGSIRGYTPHRRKTPTPSLHRPPSPTTYPIETTQPVTELVSEAHIIQQPIAGPSGVLHPAVVASQMAIPAAPIPPEMPPEVEDVLARIGKKNAESQTDPFTKTMQEINQLIRKFPELKDVIVNALLGELIKSRNYSKQDIEKIKEMYSESKPFVVKAYQYSKPVQMKPALQPLKKAKSIYDYENFIPPNSVTARF